MLNEKIQPALTAALYMTVILMAAAGIHQLTQAYFEANPRPTPLAQPTITVSASGEAVGVPDVAKITIGVVSDGTTVAEVTAAGNTTMDGILAVVKGAGVQAEDIKTVSYNLSPSYNYKVKPYQIEGYSLNQAVRLTVRQLDDVGAIVDQATQAGANSVGTPVFEIDDPDQMQAEARAEAFTKAQVKAESLAKAAGVQLGDIVTFSENTNASPRPYYSEEYALLGEKDAAVAPSFEPGSQEATIEMSVTYQIK
ncbi:MAG: SIMPL domain-containing protein [Candidatus Kerfeldbacteria bacterium]|nr:SIMPL domain-containing protein [Candidatus Kerfeldbacteria bacterium]